jgi:Asp-tRNA(Asn)/Glu-tRNA(Gln) amidotransferase A subunit family amidase
MATGSVLEIAFALTCPSSDMPTRHNSPILADGGSSAIDAACVDVLRNAGALIFGAITV